MKKIITILAILLIAVSASFASVKSFDGNTEAAPTMSVTLKSSLKPTSYGLSLFYNDINFTDLGKKTLENLDLTRMGITREFKVMISKGNLNKTITFVTEITEMPFTGLVDGEIYKTHNNLRVLNSDGEKQTTFTSKIIAGPQNKQTIAEFLFNWDADTQLPAGDYETTNTINISVS